MHIIFEEHQYEAALVQNVLKDICALQDVEKKVSVSYVGYFYSNELKDCVFILPKVLLCDRKDENGNIIKDDKGKPIEIIADIPKYKGDDGKEHYVLPEDIIDREGQEKYLSKEYRKFIYEFAVWIFRVLTVYRKKNQDSKAIYFKQLPQGGKGKRHQANTFLDILLSLIDFNQKNQDYFMFTIKNIHSGVNKINWQRTISKSQCFIQEDTPIYLNPVNKKRKINFDEELFIIFFSILNHINNTYGFRTPINFQYELLNEKRFEQYMKGYGQTRLRQIKYKYFSDKALMLWDLCYAFFDSGHKLSVNTDQKEYLLAKNFNIVFEAMIDELIGDKDIPRGLKKQDDGKRVDHMYMYDALTRNDNEDTDEIYYIGDSKYYKNGHPLGRESIYKQYTYAKNVIQWNIDLLLSEEEATKDMTPEEIDDYKADKLNEKYKKINIRNEETKDTSEGYDIIPNFFISAFVDSDRKYIASENIKQHEREGEHSIHISYQFKNRLFDRDTFILSHYDVNFLYVIYLYARNKDSEKTAWRSKVRNKFRDEIRSVLENKYDFYAMQPKTSENDAIQFVKDHFKDLNGRIYKPFSASQVYELALEKVDKTYGTKQSETYRLLEEYFVIEPVKKLGSYPKSEIEQGVNTFISTNGGPKVYIGVDKPDTHVINEDIRIDAQKVRQNGKVAIGSGNSGSALEYIAKLQNIKFLVLKKADGTYTCFKLKGNGELTTTPSAPKTASGQFFVEYDVEGEVEKNIRIGDTDELFYRMDELEIKE